MSDSIVKNNSDFDSRKVIAKKIGVGGLIFSAFLSLIGSAITLSGEDLSPNNSVLESFANEQLDVSWAPVEFTVWRDDFEIAYRWSDDNNCESYRCVTAEFISKEGCATGFYAAVNWLDKVDSVLSYDNATLPRLDSMQIAKLRFDDIEGNSSSAQMAEISCR